MWRDLERDRWFFENYIDRPQVYFGDGGFMTPGTVRGVSLPYGSNGFYMTLLMPDTTKSMGEFMELLTSDTWLAWQNLNREYYFYFAMPRFRFEYDVTMTEVLAGMGLDIAFDPARADFSNMFVDGVGWIDYVKHKTFIQVDEHGTEAAAVTSGGYADSIPPGFIADQPFILVIHEESTGVILFIGRIADPVWED